MVKLGFVEKTCLREKRKKHVSSILSQLTGG
jgi:hypothetical protein